MDEYLVCFMVLWICVTIIVVAYLVYTYKVNKNNMERKYHELTSSPEWQIILQAIETKLKKDQEKT
jgi:hypothetical protein